MHVHGDTSTARMIRIWNLIVRTRYNGISDRPEHIAGIIGNMQVEAGSALCPFQQQVGSNRAGLGLMQWSGGRRTNMQNYLWNNNVDQRQFDTEMHKHLDGLCNPNNASHRHPQELLERVTTLQVRFMFEELRNSERHYIGFRDFPSSRTGVMGSRAYAELFCVLVLRPGSGTGSDNNIQDGGVREALRASTYVGGVGNLDRVSYNRLASRRFNAEEVFLQFLTHHR